MNHQEQGMRGSRSSTSSDSSALFRMPSKQIDIKSARGVNVASKSREIRPAFRELRTFTESLIRQIHSRPIPPRYPSSIGRLSAIQAPNLRWDLPPLIPPSGSSRLSLDETLLRVEMAWIHLSVTDGINTKRPASSEGIRYERELAEIFRTDTGASNPFKGMAQSLMAAVRCRVTSPEQVYNTLDSARNAGTTANAWRILRVEIQEAARLLDFPRFSAR